MVKNLKKKLNFSKAEKAERLKSNRLNGLTKLNTLIDEQFLQPNIKLNVWRIWKGRKMNNWKSWEGWKVRGLKELEKANSLTGCTCAGAVAEPKMKIYWVTGDIAELCDVFFISIEGKLGAPEWELKEIQSAVFQKFWLKINIVAYGGIAWVLVAVGLLERQAPTFKISWKQARFAKFVCIYCLCEVKDVGSKSSWGKFFLQFFQLLSILPMMSRTVAHTKHTHYKIRRWAKNP